jgi:hypothetical protein
MCQKPIVSEKHICIEIKIRIWKWKCTARECKVHTAREKLLKPCAIDLAVQMTEDKADKKVQLVPLSDNTMQRKI